VPYGRFILVNQPFAPDAKLIRITRWRLFRELLEQRLEFRLRRLQAYTPLKSHVSTERLGRIIRDLQRKINIGKNLSEASRQNADSRVVLVV
jgi:hypothetical protein